MANKAHVMLRQAVVMQEPKTAQTSTNKTWLKLNVAVQTTKKQDNSQYPASDYWNVNVYGEQAEKLIGKIHQKSKLDIIGDMYMGEPWTDRNNKVNITPVCNASSIDIVGGGSYSNNNNNNYNNNNHNAPADDDEAPF